MILKKLNDRGILGLEVLLEATRQGATLEMPLALLTEDDLTESVPQDVEFDIQVFDSRLDLAGFINSLLVKAKVDDDLNDIGLWAWLGAAFLDSTCPQGADGTRKPGRDYRHIPTNNWRDFYRHLTRGPVRILRLFKDRPDAAAIVLCQHPQSPGDFVEQLASRQERITNPAIIEDANSLYFNPKTGKPKRGASPNWRRPGTLRRFSDILDQLDLTYDLYSMSADNLVGLLPDEFSTYIKV